MFTVCFLSEHLLTFFSTLAFPLFDLVPLNIVAWVHRWQDQPFYFPFTFLDLSLLYLAHNRVSQPYKYLCTHLAEQQATTAPSLSCLMCDSIPSLCLISSGMATCTVCLLRSLVVVQLIFNNRLSATLSCTIMHPHFGVHAGSISVPPSPFLNLHTDQWSAIQWQDYSNMLSRRSSFQSSSMYPSLSIQYTNASIYV